MFRDLPPKSQEPCFVALGVVTLASLNLFAMLGFVAAAVYLADVRPALRQVRGRGGRSSGW